MRPFNAFFAATAFALFLAAPAVAEAQMRQGMGMNDDRCEAGMGMMCMMGEHPRLGMMGDAGMPQRVDRRLAAFKARLKITDAQTKAWDEYAAAVRDAAKAMTEQRMNTMEKARTATLPQRLDLHDAMLASHLEQLRKTKAAANALYAVLSDDQKKIADSSMMGTMRGRMRGPRQ
jgi:hypothetical protein